MHATVGNCVSLFGAGSVIVFVSLVAVSMVQYFDVQETTTFMWVRASVLLLASPLIWRLTASATQGSVKSFERLRIISTVLPVAIVVVDLVPGLCTAWYAVMQGLSVVPLMCAALLLSRTRSRVQGAVSVKSSAERAQGGCEACDE